VKDLNLIPQIVELLSQAPEFQMVRAKNRLSEEWDPRDSAGYRDYQILVQLNSGWLMEIQVIPSELYTLKRELGHKDYTAFRFLIEAGIRSRKRMQMVGAISNNWQVKAKVRCAFCDRSPRAMMPLVPTPARLKRAIEASRRVTNAILLGRLLFVPVHTVTCVPTLKVGTLGTLTRKDLIIINQIQKDQGDEINLGRFKDGIDDGSDTVCSDFGDLGGDGVELLQHFGETALDMGALETMLAMHAPEPPPRTPSKIAINSITATTTATAADRHAVKNATEGWEHIANHSLSDGASSTADVNSDTLHRLHSWGATVEHVGDAIPIDTLNADMVDAEAASVAASRLKASNDNDARPDKMMQLTNELYPEDEGKGGDTARSTATKPTRSRSQRTAKVHPGTDGGTSISRKRNKSGSIGLPPLQGGANASSP
jgi:hypothetical protein